VEVLMRREAVDTAVSRFVELPTVQRSVVILKDVLDQSLEEIAAMLDLTVNAVKAHLARGRARLKAINAQALAQPAPHPPSPAVARYVALFNQRDWDGLRAMLADDVRLVQSSHPLRTGAADVGEFFSIYGRSAPVRLVPAWLEGREVIAVYEEQAGKPSYLMWLEWTDGSASSATTVMSATSSTTRSWSWRQTSHLRATNRLCDELRSALGRVTQSDALTLAIASGGLAVVLPQ
jgi:RNA polymerase sigma-70 factor (ECF subfamily)